MSSGRACAAFAVLLTVLAGCGPKKPKVVVSPPPAAEATSLPPSQMATSLPPVPPAIPSTSSHTVKLDTTAPPEVKPEVATTEPRRAPKRHSHVPEEVKSAAAPAQTSSQPSTQVASNQPSDKTPLGQLSSANDPVGRQAISEQIDSTENGLNAIKRSLNSDEQKTVTLIRQYITRARDALNANDFDGANTLSSKAKQMLQELTKP